VKVGDLVRHEMYSPSVSPSIICDTDGDMIKIMDPIRGFMIWDTNRFYEVISESR